MAGGKWRGLRRTLFRKSQFEPHQVEETRLRRCLNRWELAGIGVSTSLGVGVYVIIGPVALKLAGPSVVLSFLIAAVAALLAGLCYAEFAARIPRAGSGYSYTYFAIGELVGFIVGWNMIAEAVCGSATVARGMSENLDVLLNGTMSTWFVSITPISVGFILPYFDLFAFFVVIIMGTVLAVGVKEGTIVNNVFVVANLVFILFIIICGACKVNKDNWYIPAEEVPTGHGVGGFFPFGVWGTLQGAAVCFYGFMGFDAICAAGEEVVDPRRTIPITIISVLGFTFLCYTSVSIVFSMMVPYYLTVNVLPVAEAFSYVGFGWAKWIVGVGSLFGLYASLFSGIYFLTRLMYCMSADGLLLRWLSMVTTCRQSPALLTIVCTIIVATLAALMEVEQLVPMVGLATLLSYTAVAVGILLLRYESDYTPGKSKYLKQMFGLGRSPTQASSRIVKVTLLLFACIALANAAVLRYVESSLIPATVLTAIAFTLVMLMMIQPQVKAEIYFMTPLVPLVPCLSIYVNIHLLMLFNVQTWIRVGIWTLIGLVIYFMTICCCKRPQKKEMPTNLRESYTNSLASRNGKPPVQIVVEGPTPPETLNRISNYGEDIETEDAIQEEPEEEIVRNDVPPIRTATKTEEIIMHQSYIENNEEKEAKIIDLLDQVLKAEEDSYGEAVYMKEQNDDDVYYNENMIQRKSLSELSDAGSDASLGNHGLSKYDVIAQVHREDLPRVSEEEEKNEKDDIIDHDYINDHEQITAFNDTDSRTDESGYSDTIDRNALESLEESKEEIPYIPVPPPLPMDENFSVIPYYKKSYTMGAKLRNSAPSFDDDEELNKPRESILSVTSNNSLSEGNLAFGSDRQIHFMSKLNNIFQNKMSHSDDEEPRKRSHSTGNVVENADLSEMRERSPMFLALKNEITSKEAAQNLRPVTVEVPEISVTADNQLESETQEEEDEDTSLSKEDLKSKLENIYAAGGPKLLKPRLIKSNPPTPDESYQTDTSSTESIAKLPKMEKNDTLKRQKDKFSQVLNSFRLSYNKDDEV